MTDELQLSEDDDDEDEDVELAASVVMVWLALDSVASEILRVGVQENGSTRGTGVVALGRGAGPKAWLGDWGDSGLYGGDSGSVSITSS